MKKKLFKRIIDIPTDVYLYTRDLKDPTDGGGHTLMAECPTVEIAQDLVRLLNKGLKVENLERLARNRSRSLRYRETRRQQQRRLKRELQLRNAIPGT